jgi:hypothetical protein
MRKPSIANLASLRALCQIISIDAGDVLPPELTEIMARVRKRAYRTPPTELGLLTEIGHTNIVQT